MDGSATSNPPPLQQPIHPDMATSGPVVTPLVPPGIAPPITRIRNTNTSPSPSSDPLVVPLAVNQDGPWKYWCTGASIPNGGSSEVFGAQENKSDFLRGSRSNMDSLSRESGYRCGLYDQLQQQPVNRPTSIQMGIPGDMSNASDQALSDTTPHFMSGVPVHHVINYASPYNSLMASAHMKNGTTPDNIYNSPCHVENGTLPNNMSGTSTQISRSLLKHELSRWQSGMNGEMSDSKLFPMTHLGNSWLGHMQTEHGQKMVPTRGGRATVRSGPFQGSVENVYTGGKTKANNDRKQETEAQDDQRVQSEQAESAMQFMSMYEKVVQDNLSRLRQATCGQHNLSRLSQATRARISGHIVGESALMGKDASLHAILGSLLYLSDILLSSHFNACEFKDCDHELLQSVTTKLGSYIIKNKKEADGILPDWEHAGELVPMTLMRASDEVIGQVPNADTASTDGELDSITAEPASDDDGISSDWEHVDESGLH